MLRANSRTVPIEDIKIPEAFAATTPGRNKVEMRKAFYKVAGKFDKEIIVDRKGYLFDGYSAYIAAKELGLDKVPVVQIVPFERKKKVDKPTEPTEQKEPFKLYCTKDYMPGEWVTEGKIYELDGEGKIHFDDGYTKAFDTLLRPSSVTNALFPLVARPAKVGEWILVTNRSGLDADIYENGNACKVVDVNRNKPLHSDGVFIKTLSGKTHPCNRGNGTAFLFDSEYEVLDGYHAEPKKEPEPEYYSGKVVCVKADGYFTAGKVYEFRDGLIKSDTGDSYNKGEPIKSLEELGDGTWMPKFIEYKGEAND